MKEKLEKITDVTPIGDVHGCSKTAKALVEQVLKKHPKTKICFAGDLIDRGPDSRSVVQYVIDNGFDCVQGNHEQMMLDWNSSYGNMLWLGNGGDITLDSYHEGDHGYLKGELNKKVFEEHRLWMSTLPILIEYPDCKTPDGRSLVVSHSICHNYYKALHGKNQHRAEQAASQIPWNRSFSSIKDQGFFNVIGHTPDECNPKIKKIYANIDTGAFCGYGGWKKFKKGGLGYLTALHVPTMTIYRQECIDD